MNLTNRPVGIRGWPPKNPHRRHSEPKAAVLQRVRDVCRMRDLEKLAFAEIGRRLGVSGPAAFFLWHRWHEWCAERRIGAPPSAVKPAPVVRKEVLPIPKPASPFVDQIVLQFGVRERSRAVEAARELMRDLAGAIAKLEKAA